MPRATLLGKESARYDLILGVAKYVFKGGRPKEVPVAAAIELSKKLDRDGHHLFKIEDMPTIVEPRTEKLPPAKSQNVTAAQLTEKKTGRLRQRTFDQ